MAFIVEDGTGVTDANSYATLAEYKDYFADRAIDVTSESDADIQGRLVRAADYNDDSFNFCGYKTYDTTVNDLEFPRTDLDYYDSDEVPQPVIEFCIEIARSLVGKESVEASDAQIASKSIGPVSVTYATSQETNSSLKKATKKYRNKLLTKGQACRV
jgi:hypothetical protein